MRVTSQRVMSQRVMMGVVCVQSAMSCTTPTLLIKQMVQLGVHITLQSSVCRKRNILLLRIPLYNLHAVYRG